MTGIALHDIVIVKKQVVDRRARSKLRVRQRSAVGKGNRMVACQRRAEIRGPSCGYAAASNVHLDGIPRHPDLTERDRAVVATETESRRTGRLGLTGGQRRAVVERERIVIDGTEPFVPERRLRVPVMRGVAKYAYPVLIRCLDISGAGR